MLAICLNALEDRDLNSINQVASVNVQNSGQIIP